MNWKYVVDAAYCICLKERDDRYQESHRELKRTNLLEITEYYRPIRHPKGGLHGCYESHRAVIQKGIASGHKYILILEDDVEFNLNYNRRRWPVIQTAIMEFKEDKTLDIYYLGHVPLLAWPMWSLYLYHCQSAQTHAYILNLNGRIAQFVAATPYYGLQIDFLYLRAAKAVASVPMIAFQRVSASDTLISDNLWRKFVAFFYKRPDLSCQLMEVVHFIVLPMLLLGVICICIGRLETRQ